MIGPIFSITCNLTYYFLLSYRQQMNTFSVIIVDFHSFHFLPCHNQQNNFSSFLNVQNELSPFTFKLFALLDVKIHNQECSGRLPTAGHINPLIVTPKHSQINI